MNNSRKCPERMRTILQAMERSIEAARRSRMKLPGDDSPLPMKNTTTAPAAFSRPATAPFATPQQENAPRMKARPKRPDTPLVNPFQQPSYRSQTG